MGQIKMFRTRTVLNYRETKPEVFKLRQLIYPTIKEKDLIKYIANSANVPLSTIQAAVEAIGEAIAYFSINGHRVSIPNFGGFWVKVNVKSAATADEVTLKSVKKCRLAYMPATELRELITTTSTAILNDAIYGINVPPKED